MRAHVYAAHTGAERALLQCAAGRHVHIEQVPGVGTIIDALRHALADALGSVVLGAALLFALGASFYFSFSLEATPPPATMPVGTPNINRYIAYADAHAIPIAASRCALTLCEAL